MSAAALITATLALILWCRKSDRQFALEVAQTQYVLDRMEGKS